MSTFIAFVNERTCITCITTFRPRSVIFFLLKYTVILSKYLEIIWLHLLCKEKFPFKKRWESILYKHYRHMIMKSLYVTYWQFLDHHLWKQYILPPVLSRNLVTIDSRTPEWKKYMIVSLLFCKACRLISSGYSMTLLLYRRSRTILETDL